MLINSISDEEYICGTEEGRCEATWKREFKLPWRKNITKIISMSKWIRTTSLSINKSHCGTKRERDRERETERQRETERERNSGYFPAPSGCAKSAIPAEHLFTTLIPLSGRMFYLKW
jgi:hypothetical protein